ncbi:MAG: ComEC/Rec2 family competence protein [Bacillota bacterium]
MTRRMSIDRLLPACCFTSPHRSPRKVRWPAALAAFALVFLLAVFLLPLPGARGATGPAKAELVVHFIDVGQGDSILVQTPSGKTMLIDGGPVEASERLLSYLKTSGVERIDVLVATHPHADHIGGLQEVLRTFPVGLVVDPGKVHTTATYERFLTLVDQKDIPFRLGRAGDEITLDSELEVDVLNPAEPLPESVNDCSVVIKISYGKVSFLLTADVEKEAENAMLGRGADLQATVLKVAHHGSRSSSSPWFLKKVKPRVAVIQAGSGNPYGHPHRITILNLQDYTDKIYRTDRSGSIVVASDGHTFTVKPERGTP